MGRQAAEIVVHGMLVVVVIALLVQLPVNRSPTARFGFWLLGLCYATVLPPLYWLLFPTRAGDGFRDGWALLSVERWSAMTWHGHALGMVLPELFALVGVALFLRDLVPLVWDAATLRLPRPSELPLALLTAAERARLAVGAAMPRLLIQDTSGVVLVCRGLRRPVIVVSTAVVAALEPDELVAALAHEMCHATRRDPLLGLLLMIVRGGFIFSPGVQIAARALVSEMEGQADERAARGVGDARLVAGSLRKLADGPAPATSGWERLQRRAIERRCAHLLAPSVACGVPPCSLIATAVGLALLLLFTVV